MSYLYFYKKHLPITAERDLVELFQNNILRTNRDYNFFVNWKKVQQNLIDYKIKLNLLNSLIGSTNLKKDFEYLVRNYPEVLQIFPILIAQRNHKLDVVSDIKEVETNIDSYSFDIEKDTKLEQKDIERFYDFMEKMGINKLFFEISDFYDYVFGVEVGMDTNARKNRGGTAMERITHPIIEKLSEKYKIHFFAEKIMGELGEEFGIEIPEDYRNRRCDFLLIKDKKLVNIEVNYYSSSGSKPEEIVNSYIQRKNSLSRADIEFIWITDGNGWKVSTNQLAVAFKMQKYLFNLSFVKQGLLEDALREIFELR